MPLVVRYRRPSGVGGNDSLWVLADRLQFGVMGLVPLCRHAQVPFLPVARPHLLDSSVGAGTPSFLPLPTAMRINAVDGRFARVQGTDPWEEGTLRVQVPGERMVCTSRVTRHCTTLGRGNRKGPGAQGITRHT